MVAYHTFTNLRGRGLMEACTNIRLLCLAGQSQREVAAVGAGLPKFPRGGVITILTAAFLASRGSAHAALVGRLLAPHRDSAESPPPWRQDGEASFFHGNEAAASAQVLLEVPQTFSKFMEGLMYRKSISDEQGMLFQWNSNGFRSFWMENTYVDLDIIYVNAEGRVVSIRQAHSLDLQSVPATAPAKDAIEVPMGWCKRHGITIGDRVNYKINSAAYFVANDAHNFGATEDEAKRAVADGNFDALTR